MKRYNFLLSLILTLSLLTGLCAPSALATDGGNGIYVGAGFGAAFSPADEGYIQD